MRSRTSATSVRSRTPTELHDRRQHLHRPPPDDAASWINEASLTFQRFSWNTCPDNFEPHRPGLPGRACASAAPTPSSSSSRTGCRCATTFRASRVERQPRVQAGLVLSRMGYDVTKFFTANPVFRYRSAEQFVFPFEAQIGSGDPNLNADNTQSGPLPPGRLEPHAAADAEPRHPLGLRVEPAEQRLRHAANVRAATQSFVPANYFTDGDDRPPFKGPSSRASDSPTTSTGTDARSCSAASGATTTACCTTTASTSGSASSSPYAPSASPRDGAPRDGQPTLVWNDSFLTARRAQRHHRQRPHRQPRDLPHRQRHEPPGLRPVLGRACATSSAT